MKLGKVAYSSNQVTLKVQEACFLHLSLVSYLQAKSNSIRSRMEFNKKKKSTKLLPWVLDKKPHWKSIQFCIPASVIRKFPTIAFWGEFFSNKNRIMTIKFWFEEHTCSLLAQWWFSRWINCPFSRCALLSSSSSKNDLMQTRLIPTYRIPENYI